MWIYCWSRKTLHPVSLRITPTGKHTSTNNNIATADSLTFFVSSFSHCDGADCSNIIRESKWSTTIRKMISRVETMAMSHRRNELAFQNADENHPPICMQRHRRPIPMMDPSIIEQMPIWMRPVNLTTVERNVNDPRANNSNNNRNYR